MARGFGYWIKTIHHRKIKLWAMNCHIITQFRNLTNNVNQWTLARKNHWLRQFAGILPYAHKMNFVKNHLLHRIRHLFGTSLISICYLLLCTLVCVWCYYMCVLLYTVKWENFTALYFCGLPLLAASNFLGLKVPI